MLSPYNEISNPQKMLFLNSADCLVHWKFDLELYLQIIPLTSVCAFTYI